MDFRTSLMKVGFEWIQPSGLEVPERYRTIKGSKFIKRYTTTLGEFKVLLINRTSNLTRLPFAYVIERPNDLDEIALPHIRNSGEFCYADNDQTEWSPHDPEGFAQAIDNKITKTLLNSIDNIGDAEEYRNEFSNYWEADSTAFSFEALPTSTKVLSYSSFDVKNGQSVKSETEYVVYTNAEEKNRWLELRGESAILEEGTAIAISVKPNNWAPISNWPPSNFTEILVWLSKADRSAHDHLIDQMVQLAIKRILVILQIAEEGQLGFKVSLSTRHLELVKSWKTRKKRSLKPMIDSFSSQKAIESYSRLRVEAVDPDAIFLRNRPQPDLGDIRNQRIALVGCGTIGGYVAELLMKAGAGVGPTGNLTIYDSDTLSVGNLGRHRLPISFLKWNKAEAMAKLLKAESFHKVSVNGIKKDLEVSEQNLKDYDVVIDATGRVPVSLALAKVVRSFKKKPPILIHGFNDVWGQESVALIDNGKACYGCLEKLAPANIQPPKFNTSRYSCGSFYTPYDASVSVISASLIVEAVLNTLEDKLKWSYAKVARDTKKQRKFSLLKPWADCEVCCQGRLH